MAVNKWIFTDISLATPETYTFEINPLEGSAPSYRKNIETSATTAPDGATLLFEGNDQPRKFDLSGSLVSQEQHDALVEWFQKRVVIQVTDDLLRDFNIYIESLDLSRRRATNHPWSHSWKMTAFLVD